MDQVSNNEQLFSDISPLNIDGILDRNHATSTSQGDSEQHRSAHFPVTKPISLMPLISALCEAVQEVSSQAEEESTATLQDAVHKARELIFALLSAIGSANHQVLSNQEHQNLWVCCSMLWETALDHRSSSFQNDLFSLGQEVFNAAAAGPTISSVRQQAAYLCALGQSWKEDNPVRCWWCLEQALKLCRDIELFLATNRCLSPEDQEVCVVDMFQVHAAAATEAATNNRQAVANNLMAKIIDLRKHRSLSPCAAAAMCCGIAELQLHEASKAMDTDQALVAQTIIAAAIQELKAASELVDHIHPDNMDVIEALGHDIARFANEATLLHSTIYLHNEEYARVIDCLVEFNGNQVDCAAASILRLKAHLALSESKAALKQLYNVALQALDDDQCKISFLHALSIITHATPAAPAAQHWSELGDALIKKLRSMDQGLIRILDLAIAVIQHADASGELALALHLLARQDVIVVIFETSATMQGDIPPQIACYSALVHEAEQRYDTRDYSASEALFAAAMQYAPPEKRGNITKAMVACCYKQGRSAQGAEYLDTLVGATACGGGSRNGEGPSALVQLLRCLVMMDSGTRCDSDMMQGLKAVTRSDDFQPSLLRPLLQLASQCCPNNQYVQNKLLWEVLQGYLPMQGGSKACLSSLGKVLVSLVGCMCRDIDQKQDPAELLQELTVGLRHYKDWIDLSFETPDRQLEPQCLRVCSWAFNAALVAVQRQGWAQCLAVCDLAAEILEMVLSRMRENLIGVQTLYVRFMLLGAQACLDQGSTIVCSPPHSNSQANKLSSYLDQATQVLHACEGDGCLVGQQLRQAVVMLRSALGQDGAMPREHLVNVTAAGGNNGNDHHHEPQVLVLDESKGCEVMMPALGDAGEQGGAVDQDATNAAPEDPQPDTMIIEKEDQQMEGEYGVMDQGEDQVPDPTDSDCGPTWVDCIFAAQRRILGTSSARHHQASPPSADDNKNEDCEGFDTAEVLSVSSLM